MDFNQLDTAILFAKQGQIHSMILQPNDVLLYLMDVMEKLSHISRVSRCPNYRKYLPKIRRLFLL